MRIIEKDGVTYHQFEIFQGRITHGIFTRLGGVSQPPWDTLNAGGTVGDDPDHVIENRRRILRTIGKDPESVFDVWQVHSSDVVITSTPREIDSPHKLADGILTNQPGITLMMRFADCVPILLYDPENQVVGIAHAGWQGTVKGITSAIVAEMIEKFHSNPEMILAGIGPSIGPDHYEVGLDVFNHVKGTFGEASELFVLEKEGRFFFNLWAANAWQLREKGLKNIEISKTCTACDTRTWFSHRAERGKTGRFGAIIAL